MFEEINPMKKGFTLVLLFFLVESFAQNLQWGFGQAGQGTQFARGLLVRNGRLYQVGVFENSFDADPGPSSFVLNSAGGQDVYLAVYDTDGNFIYANSFGSSGNESGMPGIALDPFGNIYLTFEYVGTLDIDPGPGIVTHTSSSATDCILAKFDSTGNYTWSFSLDALVAETSNGIVADSNALYLTGAFVGSVDFDPSASNTLLTASATGLYVAKYSLNGVLDWAFSIDNQHPTGTGNNVRLDSSGNLLVAGYFGGNNIDFDPGPSQALMSPSSNVFDFFLAKYTSDGQFIWAHHTGGVLDNVTYGLELDGDEIVVGGYIQGTNVDLDPGPATLLYDCKGNADSYLARFASTGALLWAKAFGEKQYEDVLDMAIAPDGDIVVVGGFGSDTTVIDPGDTLFSPTLDNSTFDGYIAEFDRNGNYKWSMVYGDSLWDQGVSINIDERIRSYSIPTPVCGKSSSLAIVRSCKIRKSESVEKSVSITFPRPSLPRTTFCQGVSSKALLNP